MDEVDVARARVCVGTHVLLEKERRKTDLLVADAVAVEAAAAKAVLGDHQPRRPRSPRWVGLVR